MNPINYPSEQADTIGLILWLVAGLVVVLYLCAHGDQRDVQPLDEHERALAGEE